MKIGFDLMGSDTAPQSELQALGMLMSEEGSADILVVGKGNYEKEVRDIGYEFALADEVVGMHEIPTVAVRQKPNSSLGILFQLLKRREIDAVVSAGNTGAIVAFGMLGLGTIPSIRRPGLAITLPTQAGYAVILDVGANVKPKAEEFVKYGIMGSIFFKSIMDRESPRVSLLNIGEEIVKGDEVRQHAYELLKKSGLNFIGNIEGNNIMKGFADVIITDGFTGNVVLKYTEGVIDTIWSMLRETVDGAKRGRFGQFLVRPAVKDLKAKFSYEEYGGGVLVGVQGVVIVCHGRSSALALKNAIKMARSCVEHDLVGEITTRTAS